MPAKDLIKTFVDPRRTKSKPVRKVGEIGVNVKKIVHKSLAQQTAYTTGFGG